MPNSPVHALSLSGRCQFEPAIVLDNSLQLLSIFSMSIQTPFAHSHCGRPEERSRLPAMSWRLLALPVATLTRTPNTNYIPTTLCSSRFWEVKFGLRDCGVRRAVDVLLRDVGNLSRPTARRGCVQCVQYEAIRPQVLTSTPHYANAQVFFEQMPS
ncbi:hypothetical protein CC2G_007958 [Coprinopsis cinerea AmutBmut pab1-1]|nr:hypothetical protein CC2G_007958 [Coprinopsis cinerea AmutBmut pab1-1]